MLEMPSSDIYERELFFMPYRDSINAVLNLSSKLTPSNGKVLDLMCGPGYLLGKLSIERPDLKLKGVDIEEKYIDTCKSKYSNMDFEVRNVLQWNTSNKFDLVLCTGAVHHLPYERQKEFITRIPDFISDKGFAIVSDCYIGNYFNEKERQREAARLGHAYLKATKENGADKEVLDGARRILINDITKKEFKTSIEKRSPIFEKIFNKVFVTKAWPDFNSGYGDYIHVLYP